MFITLVTFLNAMAPHLRFTIIGVSADGAYSMTGRIISIVSRVQQVCKPGIIRVWCGLHQLNLVMQKVYPKALDDDFYLT